MGDIVLEKTLAHLPEVKRGYGFQMYASGKKEQDRIAYTNGTAVFLRDLNDPSKSSIFVGEHKGNCNVAAISPNGEWVASGDDQGTLIVWGQGNQSVKLNTGINKSILDIAWDADGKRIVCVGDGTEAKAKCVAWDTGSALGNVGGHTGTVLSCDYKPTRPYRIVTASEDMTACFHQGPPFKFDKTIKDHSNYINKCKYSPDGEKFVTVSSDKQIIAYDGKTGDKIKVIESKDGHTASIYSFAWSPCGNKLLTCGADKTAKVWNYESGEVETTFQFPNHVSSMQMCAVWHKDFMLTVSLSGAINYLDLDSASVKKSTHGHLGKVNDVVIDTKNSINYTCDVNGYVCQWKDNVATWFRGDGHKKAITALALNHDGSKLLTVGLDDKLRVNDTAAMEFNADAVALGGAPCSVAAGNKSDLVAVGLGQCKVVVKAGDNMETLATDQKPWSVAFNPDDSKLAVGFHKGGVKVYNVSGTALKLDYELKDLNKPVMTLKWSPCGAYLVASGDDKRTIVYKDQKVMNPTEWEFHTGGVTSHAWSPSGSRIATVSSDLTLFVWEDMVKFGTKRKTLKMAHRVNISKCAWIDEETLLTVGGDSCLKIWKV